MDPQSPNAGHLASMYLDIFDKLIKTIESISRSTATRGTMTASTSWNNNESSIVISFNKNIPLKRIGFKEFGFSTFFADLGGSIGLWLGLGVVQILELLIKILMKK